MLHDFLCFTVSLNYFGLTWEIRLGTFRKLVGICFEKVGGSFMNISDSQLAFWKHVGVQDRRIIIKGLLR